MNDSWFVVFWEKVEGYRTIFADTGFVPILVRDNYGLGTPDPNAG